MVSQTQAQLQPNGHADSSSTNGFPANGHAKTLLPSPTHPDLPNLPSYDELPLNENRERCSWGVWERILGLPRDVPDELGCLNFLTPSVKLAAAKEVATGQSFALNWMNEALHSGRRKRLHRIMPFGEGEGDSEWVGNDDEVTFNTQGGSQWDGFRHWAHQSSQTFYNGVKQEDIMGESRRNGIDRWSAAGGVTGRAVLLDYAAWLEAHDLQADHDQRFTITVGDLEAVARWEGVELRPGDILLVRCGFLNWFESLSEEEREEAGKKTIWSGLDGSEEMVRWLWNHHFAAVGGDAAVCEAWPAKDDKWRLHDHLIALLGIPLGEMFDLEELSKACKQAGKWTCLFTSAPINIPRGIASPPNAICVL